MYADDDVFYFILCAAANSYKSQQLRYSGGTKADVTVCNCYAVVTEVLQHRRLRTAVGVSLLNKPSTQLSVTGVNLADV